jgi:hypothetical protein
MGDMAGFSLDSQMWPDDSYWGADEFEEPEGQPIPGKTCRCCGLHGLSWFMEGDKWRLFVREMGGTYTLHVCPAVPLNNLPKPEKKA